MAHRIGLSGSVIMTDPAKFRELFKPGIRHIEIGEFPDLQSFHDFLALLSGKDMTFGLHSPLLRNQSKYDLLEYVHVPTEQAWSQLERELDLMADLGAQYVLVHFPYFREKAGRDAPAMIENGLKRLHALQEKHGIPVVCEPKLGLGRSPVGIDALHGFPVETWAKYGLKLCIDIGDYLIAAGERVLEYVGKFRDLIKVVHLHNVEFIGDGYFWIPVHPSHEEDGVHYRLGELISLLSTCEDLYFIFEHTPHTNPAESFVDEGIGWVREMIGS